MTIMKKHLSIVVDFQSTVKLSGTEQKKLQRWLEISSEVLAQMLLEKGFIHPSWLSGTDCLRVSLLLCGTIRIRQLNRDHRAKDKVTDVLSFPSFEGLRSRRPKNELPGAELFLGDLAICHQKAQTQARQFKVSYMDEFIHLYVHGFLHLLGYDHELSGREEEIMQKWEQKTLNLFSKIVTTQVPLGGESPYA